MALSLRRKQTTTTEAAEPPSPAFSFDPEDHSEELRQMRGRLRELRKRHADLGAEYDKLRDAPVAEHVRQQMLKQIAAMVSGEASLEDVLAEKVITHAGERMAEIARERKLLGAAIEELARQEGALLVKASTIIIDACKERRHEMLREIVGLLATALEKQEALLAYDDEVAAHGARWGEVEYHQGQITALLGRLRDPQGMFKIYCAELIRLGLVTKDELPVWVFTHGRQS